MPKVAYDIDGVLCPMPKRDKPFFKQNGVERNKYKKLKQEHFMFCPVLMRPKEKTFYLITGRKEHERGITEEWLENNEIKPKEVRYMTGSLTFKNILAHKIKSIKELGIDTFYEDDPKLVRYLRKAIPELTIIHIPRDENNVKILLDK